MIPFLGKIRYQFTSPFITVAILYELNEPRRRHTYISWSEEAATRCVVGCGAEMLIIMSSAGIKHVPVRM